MKGNKLTIFLSLLGASWAQAAAPIDVDVCVYGGTSAGVIAAEAVAKAGKSVVLVEPGRHLGGLTSGGLGKTDIGNKMVIGGMSREFYELVGKAYGTEEAWLFEPHVAEKVFSDLVVKYKIQVILDHRITGVAKEGAHLQSITLEHAPADAYNAPVEKGTGEEITIRAKEFIDAGYEGDLMARANVSYRVGREGVAEYHESLDGVRAKTPKHQFLVAVDPFIKPGDPASGLLPLMKETDGGRPGAADRRVQAYTFRVCLTDVQADRSLVTAPPGYDAGTYELLARYLAALEKEKVSYDWKKALLKFDLMPNRKTDINNNGAVSTDYIGMSWEYPDADYGLRGKIWHAHRDYVQGLFYFLMNDPRVPAAIRGDLDQWGLAKDEFQDTGGWPHQLYVREARRMVGDYVITQEVCEHKKTAEDSIGMAAYNMDSHNCDRIVKDGAAINEGDVEVAPRGPYPIAYRAITPKGAEADNLLVPVCLSATHIAYGSIRMEPVFMVLGQSSGLAACQAIDEQKAVQGIDVKKLQGTLREAGQVLYYAK
ncbi:MAG TPA: FAD-dependent oxidoreductase [Tepidisphaeraceae bacterium]|jgi:hypothetical protein|nr:FAD-dependent oxidoreductase [Tepidisphaeraceae bacterium]